MSLYQQFKSDANLEKSGILLEYGFSKSGKPITIRIARAGGGNSAFTKRMEAKVKPYRRQIQTETIDTAIVEKLLREVYAETVVLGWENVEDADGNPLDFTAANCIKLFEDLHAAAYHDAEMGRPTPGLKLVPGRAGARQWRDEKKAEILLKHDFGEDAYTKKLLSPAAVEDVVGKRKFKDRFARSVIQSDAKAILVPDTDKREPVKSAASDFDDLEDDNLV